VNAELRSKELSEEAIAKLQPIIQLSGTNREKIAVLKEVLAGSETGLRGVAELEFIFDRVDLLTVKAELELDLTLARGLNYYTGAIFEVKALDVQIGSITGGDVTTTLRVCSVWMECRALVSLLVPIVYSTYSTS
jgi:histidyl-tRNA synthetase (EC 6.1.1.21)